MKRKPRSKFPSVWLWKGSEDDVHSVVCFDNPGKDSIYPVRGQKFGFVEYVPKRKARVNRGKRK